MQSKCYVTLWAGAHYSKLSSPRCIMPSKLSSVSYHLVAHMHTSEDIFLVCHMFSQDQANKKLGNLMVSHQQFCQVW